MQLFERDWDRPGSRKPPSRPHAPGGSELKPYIVDIRPRSGAEIEQYWIDGRDRHSVACHAARLAGVKRGQVVKVARFTLG